MAIDYFKRMREATTDEERVEIYLLAEVSLQDADLEHLVTMAKSEPVLESFIEKVQQEQHMLSDRSIPQHFKRSIPRKECAKHKKTNIKITNERW